MAWGVDSARTPNSTAVDGTVCFDSVAERAGASPAFWGRYIGARFAMDKAEAAFLHAKGCLVLPIYNGTSNTVGSVKRGLAEGQADANAAATAALTLGIPAGVAIYADVEGSWAVTSDWIRGWATGITARNFVSGLYGDCRPGATFAQAYCAAQEVEPIVGGSLLWSMEPEPNPQCQPAGNSPAYAPAKPACGGTVVLWQYTENCWEDTLGENGGIDMNLAMDAALA
jgi:glycoside hydrolase-like protein